MTGCCSSFSWEKLSLQKYMFSWEMEGGFGKKNTIFYKNYPIHCDNYLFSYICTIFYAEYEEVCHYGVFGLSMSHGMWT